MSSFTFAWLIKRTTSSGNLVYDAPEESGVNDLVDITDGTFRQQFPSLIRIAVNNGETLPSQITFRVLSKGTLQIINMIFSQNRSQTDLRTTTRSSKTCCSRRGWQNRSRSCSEENSSAGSKPWIRSLFFLGFWFSYSFLDKQREFIVREILSTEEQYVGAMTKCVSVWSIGLVSASYIWEIL